MNENISPGPVTVSFLFGLIIGLICGLAIGEAASRGEAIKAGVAEYVVDSKTGATTFVLGVPDKSESKSKSAK